MITPTSATDLLSYPAPKPQPDPKRRAHVMRTQEQWKALLGEFNNSGLTRAAFCKKHRIATRSLYRWQQVFVEDAGVIDFIDVTQPLSNPPAPTNPGKIRHEFSIGNAEEQVEHAKMMREMPNMIHWDGNILSLAPGESGETIWRFQGDPNVLFACNIPGHFEAGMFAKLRVSEAHAEH